jgi:DNA-binding transcriptional LysR family regulator
VTVILDKRLRVFLAVAEAGSFSRAARKLSLSQSVVSFHIHGLEDELGVRLFRRKGRSISLTREGEILYREGRRLAQSAREIEDRFAAESEAIAQRISLAGDALTCAFTLPWTLAGFRRDNPDVVYSYEHLDQDELLERLLSGELDVALVGHPVKHRKLKAQACFRDEIILVVRPGTVPKRIKPAALTELPLVWPTNDSGLELLLSRELARAGVALKDLNVFMEVENLPILKTFVRAGVGVAFLPRLAVADELAFDLLAETKVAGLKLERTNYLVYRKERHPREVLTRFVEYVAESDWDELSRSQPPPKRRR